MADGRTLDVRRQPVVGGTGSPHAGLPTEIVARAETIGAIMVEELAPLRYIRAFGRFAGSVRWCSGVRREVGREGSDRRGTRARRARHHLRLPRPGRSLHTRAHIGESDLRKGMRTFVEQRRAAQVASPA